MGADRKARYDFEAQFARTFEEWLLLHKWQWWHVNLPMRSRDGFPDYECYRERVVWVELKARNPFTGRPGKLSAEQIAFHDTIRRAGGEVHVFLLPDDWKLVEECMA